MIINAFDNPHLITTRIEAAIAAHMAATIPAEQRRKGFRPGALPQSVMTRAPVAPQSRIRVKNARELHWDAVREEIIQIIGGGKTSPELDKLCGHLRIASMSSFMDSMKRRGLVTCDKVARQEGGVRYIWRAVKK